MPRGRGEKLGRAFAAVKPADLVPKAVNGDPLARVARTQKVSLVRLRKLNAILPEEEVPAGTVLLFPRSAAK